MQRKGWGTGVGGYVAGCCAGEKSGERRWMGALEMVRQMRSTSDAHLPCVARGNKDSHVDGATEGVGV